MPKSAKATTRRPTEVRIPPSVFSHLPRVGGLVRNPRSNGIVRVTAARRVSGEKNAFLVVLQSVKRDDVPAGTAIPEWPKLARGRPKAPPPAPLPSPIETPRKRSAKQRAHVMALLDDDRNEARVIPTVRLNSAIEAEWRDPADVSVYRKKPRLIRGHRSWDAIEYLLERKDLARRQVVAARRVRKDYEIGVVGLRGGTGNPLDRVSGSFGPSDGPGETKSRSLEQFNQARIAVGKSLWGMIQAIVLENESVSVYALRVDVHYQTAQSRLMSALDRLADHYETRDEQDVPTQGSGNLPERATQRYA